VDAAHVPRRGGGLAVEGVVDGREWVGHGVL
jgi:hypothetical protein